MWRMFSRTREAHVSTHSQHRRIASGFLWVSFFVLIGKLAGAAKEMAIAWRYGVSATVDAYVFVFNLISWPVSVWFSLLAAILVPIAARLRQENPSELPRFRDELLAFALVLGLAFGALFLSVLPFALAQGWTGLSGVALEEARGMVAPLSLILPLGLIISLLSTWLMASGRHRNTLLEAVPAMGILLALLLPSDWLAEPLIWGTLLGVALQLFALAWSLRRAGELNAPVFRYQSPVWKAFWGSIGVLSVGQILASLAGIVDQFLAAGLPEGSISTLGYCNRVLALVLGMGALAIGRATLPVFSEARASGRADVNELAFKWALWMFLGGIVIATAGVLLSPHVIQLLFERGAFTAENTVEVTRIFRWSLVQVPFYFSSLVLVSALGSGGHYALIALSGASNLLFKLLFALPLVKHYELEGLVISTSAMYIVSLGILYVAVRVVDATHGEFAK